MKNECYKPNVYFKNSLERWQLSSVSLKLQTHWQHNAMYVGSRHERRQERQGGSRPPPEIFLVKFFLNQYCLANV